MKDKPITQERLEELQEIEKEISIFSNRDKPPYEIVSSQGYHLLDIGVHVEAWLSDKFCFIFEDNEMIAGFAHNDYKDEVLKKHVSSMYNNELPNHKVIH
jgi:hypothetical protein